MKKICIVNDTGLVSLLSVEIEVLLLIFFLFFLKEVHLVSHYSLIQLELAYKPIYVYGQNFRTNLRPPPLELLVRQLFVLHPDSQYDLLEKLSQDPVLLVCLIAA